MTDRVLLYPIMIDRAWQGSIFATGRVQILGSIMRGMVREWCGYGLAVYLEPHLNAFKGRFQRD